MKYIRTKDGIFKVIKNDYPHYTHVEMKYTPGVMMHESVIEKSADAIEELCDALVLAGEYEGKEFHKYFPTESDSFDGLKKFYREIECEIYGAIWTKNGLIYVAKKNREGELELL